MHDGHLYYLGLLGTDHCAEYSVTASYFTPWKLEFLSSGRAGAGGWGD